MSSDTRTRSSTSGAPGWVATRAQIERTCNIPVTGVERIPEFVEAGAQRLQIQLDHPFDLKRVEQALKQRG